MASTTTRREPVVRRFDYRDMDRRDLLHAIAAVVFAILLIWNLALTSAVNGRVKNILAAVQSQQKNMDSLQQQVSDNEQKREGDMAALRSSNAPKPAAATNGAAQSKANNGNGGTAAMPAMPNTLPPDLGTGLGTGTATPGAGGTGTGGTTR